MVDEVRIELPRRGNAKVVEDSVARQWQQAGRPGSVAVIDCGDRREGWLPTAAARTLAREGAAGIRFENYRGVIADASLQVGDVRRLGARVSRVCPVCGTSKGNVEVCPECGRGLSAVTPAWTCPACGCWNPAGSQGCLRCGRHAPTRQEVTKPDGKRTRDLPWWVSILIAIPVAGFLLYAILILFMVWG